ncbi:MAG: hypothetical protein FWG73_01290 [Planctomycetaceae bacterium]|nr:hypothetical protein [Planctomycetaceae bacterium]
MPSPTAQSPKPWYARRRYWTLALLAVAAYFCLIPSPLRVSPQTTGFTSPLLPNGDVDYFGYYEQTYIYKFSPPEDNGMRLIIAALGPKILEQASIANNVPWDEMPTHEQSKRWFEEYWVPLCEHMYIDPYVRPRFLDNPNYSAFMRKEWEANKAEGEEYDDRPDEELRKKLATAPWTAEEYPHIARWLEERSPVLDLFGVAVRKPNFVCWRQRPENNSVYMVLLPDVQAARQFGRELPVRVTERLGRGDIDGAWHDVMSMFYLSRNHYINDPVLVVNIVGIAVEGAALESAKTILQHADLTPEQLERFSQDLDALPRRMTLHSELESNLVYGCLQMIQLAGFHDALSDMFFVGEKEPITDLTSFFLWLFHDIPSDNVPEHNALTLLPFDRNIAGKRITEFYSEVRQQSGNLSRGVNSTIEKKYFETMEAILKEKGQQLSSPLRVFRIPLIRTRSQLVADYVILVTIPAFLSADHALNRSNTIIDLLRLALALERYKAANGEYPSELEGLVPEFLEDVLLDPFTARRTFVYKLAPDEETAVLLHSARWDESGETQERFLYIRLAAER